MLQPHFPFLNSNVNSAVEACVHFFQKSDCTLQGTAFFAYYALILSIDFGDNNIENNDAYLELLL